MKQKHIKKLARIGLISLAIAAGLAAAGYLIVLEGRTVLGQKIQDWVWEEHIDQITVYKADFSGSVSYTDKGKFTFTPSKVAKKLNFSDDKAELAKMDQEYGFTLKDLSTSTSVTGFFNFQNLNNPKGFSWIQSRLSNNGKAYEVKLDAKLVDLMLYTRYDYNDNVSTFLRKIDPYIDDTDKGQWTYENDSYAIQQFIDEIKQMIMDAQQGNNGLTEQQKEALKYYRLLKIKKFHGIETIHGKQTLHYSLDINKPELKAYLSDVLMSDLPELSKSQKNDLVNALVKKANIKEYDIWIGATDRKIYKYNLNVGMLSITKTLDKIQKSILKGDFDYLIEDAKEASRDAIRISHTRMYMTALALYYDEHGRYPTAKAGIPQGINEYIFENPTAPTPPDGQCSESDNNYRYSPSNNGQNYTFTFCLGSNTSGLKAGRIVVTEAGISESYQDEDYYSDLAASDKKALDNLIKLIKSLPFDASLKISYDIYDYNADKAVWHPVGALPRKSYSSMDQYMMSTWGKVDEILE